MKKKKSQSMELPITAFKVDYDSYVQETSEPDPYDDYDQASTVTDYTIKSVSFCTDSSFDCTGAFELNNALNDTVYLVHVIYSSGDSFASHERCGIEFIEVFQTEEKAERCVKQISANAKLYELISSSYHKPTEKQIIELLKEMPNGSNFNPKKQILANTLNDVHYQNERDEVKILFANPWKGYFENLDSCEVNIFRVHPEKKTKRNYIL